MTTATGLRTLLLTWGLFVPMYLNGQEAKAPTKAVLSSPTGGYVTGVTLLVGQDDSLATKVSFIPYNRKTGQELESLPSAVYFWDSDAVKPGSLFDKWLSTRPTPIGLAAILVDGKATELRFHTLITPNPPLPPSPPGPGPKPPTPQPDQSGAYVSLPKQLVLNGPGLFSIPAQTNGKIVKWEALDKQVTLIDQKLLADSKTCVGFVAKDGKYRIVAWTAVGNEPSSLAICEIVLGPLPPPGPSPEPVPPGPGPEPTPPPTPTPGPVDTVLAAKFKTAIDQDIKTTKEALKQINLLVDVYNETAQNIDKTPAKTWAEQYTIMFTLSMQKGIERRPSLSNLRTVIDNEILYPSEQALTTEFKTSLAKQFRRIAASLKAATQP